MSSVGIVGATGYTGAELIRLLSSHSGVKLTHVYGNRSVGETVRSKCAWLDCDLVLQAFDPKGDLPEVLFLCLEHGHAMDLVPKLPAGIKVVDLGADFRIRDRAVHAQVYKCEIPSQAAAAYGLPEIGNRDELRAANLIANPGCHSTAALLALKPLKDRDLIAGIPVIDSKTGVSGAGRAEKGLDSHFSELTGSVKPYAVAGHRHIPEIEQVLGRVVRFTPNLIPIARGLESSVYVPVPEGTTQAQLFDAFQQGYAGEPFVRVVTTPPTTKQVLGSNRCDISVDFDAHTGMAVVCAVLDNLVKGASGAAIQNMNLMLGFEEDHGLPKNGVWP